MRLFVQLVGRRGAANGEPNDRRHDRDVARRLRRMPAERFDALLRAGDDT